MGDFFRTARLSLVEGTLGFGLAGQARKTLKPAVSQNLQRDPRSVRKADYEKRGINSLCMIPLCIAGKAIGVIAVYAAEVDFFDEAEMRLLLELAGDIAFAVDTIDKSDKAAYLAFYDPLTGLANRTLFHERLEQNLRAVREKRKVALTILDIERFRAVNDTLGRRAGDELLKQVAARLAEQAGEEGWIARLGADTFAVVVPDVASAEDLASRTAAPLREVFSRPYQVAGTELRIGGRLGITLYPDDAAGVDDLVRNAEAALKKAKASGEHYLFFEQRMTERVAERWRSRTAAPSARERGVRAALPAQGRPRNPRASSASRRCIRWQSPELGLVPPVKFIPCWRRPA